MLTVYLETTIPSYLVARPSRDLVIAGHQQITHDWWERASSQFELVVSEAVLREIQAGDPNAAAERLRVVEGLKILPLSAEVRSVAGIYAQRLALPNRAATDLLHLAFAVAYEIDYLVTWNCAHIANGQVIRRLLQVNGELRRSTPIIVTPEELLEP